MTCTDSGFLAMLGAGWDMIVNGYDDGKQKVADGISWTIPYCDDSQNARMLSGPGSIMVLLMYTGIPANLPNSDEAVARGVTML